MFFLWQCVTGSIRCRSRSRPYTDGMELSQKRFRKGGALAVGVSGDATEYVNGFRRRYDQHASRIMPHITLAFAPELDLDKWSQRRAKLAETLVAIDPFVVHVAETGVFIQEKLVLWLKPVVAQDNLERLRGIVLAAFPDVTFERRYDFVPHISIGFFETAQALSTAKNVVDSELCPFSFRVAFLSFLLADTDDIWLCVDTVDLGEQGAEGS